MFSKCAKQSKDIELCPSKNALGLMNAIMPAIHCFGLQCGGLETFGQAMLHCSQETWFHMPFYFFFPCIFFFTVSFLPHPFGDSGTSQGAFFCAIGCPHLPMALVQIKEPCIAMQKPSNDFFFCEVLFPPSSVPSHPMD